MSSDSGNRRRGVLTNASGRYFISYRRSPARPGGTTEAVRLRDALRDRGAPTWRDLDDLSCEPTEEEIVDTLRDPNTAGSVMLITPEVEDSAMIRNVESRWIFRRHSSADGFLVKLVLIGLDYGDVSRMIGGGAGLRDLTQWNIHKIRGTSLTEAKANDIARGVVESRMRVILKRGLDEPINVGLFTRLRGSPEAFDLCHDFSPYFSGRTAKSGTYRRIEKALLDAARGLVSVGNTASVLGGGNAALPVGLLYGAIFSPLSGLRVSWLQRFAGGDEETWSLSAVASDIRLKVDRRAGTVGSEDIVLALGVSSHIEAGVAEFVRMTNLRARVFMHATIEEGAVPQGVQLSPQDAVSIVLQVVQAIRSEQEELGLSRAHLHLFVACPLAMAVLLGQKLNTFSECILYEHRADMVPCYERVHVFSPSGFSY